MTHWHYTWVPTDFFVYAIFVSGFIFIFYALKKPDVRIAWRDVFTSRLAMFSFVILFFYFTIALLDSIHFYANTHERVMQSVLDFILSPLDQQDEKTYSAPFATHAFTKEVFVQSDGRLIRTYPPLDYVDRFDSTQLSLSKHLFKLAFPVFFKMSVVIMLLITLLTIGMAFFKKKSVKQITTAIFYRKNTEPAWFVFWGTTAVLLLILSVLIQWSGHFHILGTDRVGNDIFYEAIKSIRTGVVIGTLTTLIMMPFAIFCGLFAGYLGGWIDDAIQYVYTTLSSIPAVLLIAASILSLQIFMTNHPDFFTSLEIGADTRLLALCLILGITSWTSLSRLLRGEALKIREMDYIQAAIVLGVSRYQIIWRHVLPNVMHIILIAFVLDFSALVLAEAVLSYVGAGVDPTTISWGNMINSARLELAREPIVWWPLLAAFFFMFMLVLSANLFADAVREAFDPRVRKTGGVRDVESG